MKNKAFVIGDVHGMSTMLEELLSEWDSEEEQLILVGDYIDRGPGIKETVDLVRTLEKQGAWLLRGNHEAMLYDFLTNPLEFWPRYERNSGMTTLCALTGKSETFLMKLDPIELARYVNASQPWIAPWISNLPVYKEYGKWVIVHAGVDLTKNDWRKTEEFDFYWIRDAFHEGDNHTGKQFIFGHTPLAYLNELNNDLTIWQHQGKYGIDGGAVYGGDLIGLHIELDGKVRGEARITSKSQVE